MGHPQILPVHNSLPPRWLNLKAAAQWSAMGQKRLINLAKSGEVRGFQDTDSGRGDWVFDRYSLDEYRINQADPAQDRAKVLEIMRGVS